MMRKIVVAAAVGTLLAAGSAMGSAMAADLPLKAPTPVPDYIYNWTGFYVGVQTGGGWDSPNWYADPTGGPTGASPAGFHDALYKASGAFGGGQIGFNYQFGRYVVGAQADFDGAPAERFVGRNEQRKIAQARFQIVPHFDGVGGGCEIGRDV